MPGGFKEEGQGGPLTNLPPPALEAGQGTFVPNTPPEFGQSFLLSDP